MTNLGKLSISIYHQCLMALFLCLCLLTSSNSFADAVSPNLKYVHVVHTDAETRTFPESQRFNSLESNLLHFKPDLSDAYWVKPILPNGQQIDKNYLFTINPVNIHNIEMYIPALGGNTAIKKIGRFDINTAPKFSHQSIVFELPDNYVNGQEVCFYVQSRSDEALNIKYWEKDSYLIIDRKHSGIYSAVFASLLVLVLINFVFFLAIRDINYLTYVSYLTAFMLFIMMATGKIYEFEIGKWLAGNYNSTFFLYCLTCLTFTVFIQKFLRLNNYTPVFYRVTQAYVLIYLGLMLAALAIWPIPYGAFNFTNYIALVSLPIVLYAAVKAWLGGHKQAKFFIVAFIPLIGMIVLRLLAILDYIPNWKFALGGFQFAVVFQAIVLTIGLADQMLNLRKERDEAQLLSTNATRNLQKQQEFTDFIARISSDIRAEPGGNHAKLTVRSFFKRLNNMYEIKRGAVIYQVDTELKILSDNDINQAGFEDYVHDHVTEVSRICHGHELKELPTFHHPFFSAQSKMLIIPVFMRGHEWSGMLLNLEVTRKLGSEQYDSLHHYATELIHTLINAHKLKTYSIKAETDHLTQVMNRGAILEQLEKEISYSHVSQLPLTVAFLDIDHFKKINDTLGHEAGDTCLAYLALQIRRYLPKKSFVGRMGGDEFLFIFPNHLPEQAEKVLTSLSGSLETLIIEDVECKFTLSIGIARYDSSTMDLKSLLRQADETLYVSKENGRARITTAA